MDQFSYFRDSESVKLIFLQYQSMELINLSLELSIVVETNYS